ncbi:MAG: septation protein SepH, partial [Actinomycetota bacterium]|nr:septation protein SepH [Actinomycetota bacterium]
MKELYLVGLNADRDGLILAARKGGRSGGFTVTVDEDLLDHIDELRSELGGPPSGARRGKAAPRRVRSALSPREIQARLRAGSTIREVADEAGVEISWVERFAVPVLAEQNDAIDRATRLTVTTARRGASDRPLIDAVALNLADRGVRLPASAADAGWSAYHRHGSQWNVRFTFRHRGREMRAEWRADLAEGTLVCENRLATDLGFTGAGGANPVRPDADDQADELAASRALITARQVSTTGLSRRAVPGSRAKPPATPTRTGKAMPVTGTPPTASSGAVSTTPAKLVAKKLTDPQEVAAKKAFVREQEERRKADQAEKAAARKTAALEKAETRKAAERERQERRKSERSEKAAASKEAQRQAVAAKKVVEREKAVARKQAEREKATAQRSAIKARAVAKKVADQERFAAKRAADKELAVTKKAADREQAAIKKVADRKEATVKKAAAQEHAAAKKLADRQQAAAKKVADRKEATVKKAAARQQTAAKKVADRQQAAAKKAADQATVAANKVAGKKATAEQRAVAQNSVAQNSVARDSANRSPGSADQAVGPGDHSAPPAPPPVLPSSP